MYNKTQDNKHHKHFNKKRNKTQTSKFKLKTTSLPVHICPECNQPIEDISSALRNKKDGEPIHFDCALEIIKKSEDIPSNAEIVYVGNGQFALAEFPNPKNRKNFKILKTITWEEKDCETSWRDDVSNLFEVF